jgi:hypothetical protein
MPSTEWLLNPSFCVSGGATFTAKRRVVYSYAPPLENLGSTAKWVVRAFEYGALETHSEYAARRENRFRAHPTQVAASDLQQKSRRMKNADSNARRD